MAGRDSAVIAPVLRRAGQKIGDLLLPRRCLKCGATVDGGGALCAACWPLLRFIGPPQCAGCGFPFEFDQGDDAYCAACLAHPPPYDSARAVFAYDDNSRDPLLAFKHADRTDVTPAFARMLETVAGNLFDRIDLIVPVPLHRTRLISRRYNQAALLAQALGRRTGKSCQSDLLVRRRKTPSQGGLSGAARRRNVAGAFAVRERSLEDVAHRSILLIDDVFTTGATIEACSKALRSAGAREIHAVTLARVIRAADG